MPSSCWADSCARFQSPLPSHHNPVRACESPAGGSDAVRDWRKSSKVISLHCSDDPFASSVLVVAAAVVAAAATALLQLSSSAIRTEGTDLLVLMVIVILVSMLIFGLDALILVFLLVRKKVHRDHERANVRRGWMSPLSAALMASKYLVRGSPSLTRLAEPHVNAGRPSFIAITSAIRRACLPLPLGNG
jgi:hypothetical protein